MERAAQLNDVAFFMDCAAAQIYDDHNVATAYRQALHHAIKNRNVEIVTACANHVHHDVLIDHAAHHNTSVDVAVALLLAINVHTAATRQTIQDLFYLTLGDVDGRSDAFLRQPFCWGSDPVVTPWLVIDHDLDTLERICWRCSEAGQRTLAPPWPINLSTAQKQRLVIVDSAIAEGSWNVLAWRVERLVGLFVLVSDGYFAPSGSGATTARRFWDIVVALPFDLQVVVACRMFDSVRDTVALDDCAFAWAFSAEKST
jgi:hypothetical protein